MKLLRLLSYIIVLAGGIYIGHLVSENAFSERRAAEILAIQEYNAEAIQNHIYTTSFQMFPRCSAKAELSWFAGEYLAFDKTYEKFENAINHKSYANSDEEGDVIRFRLIPYVEEFIRNLESRDDVVYKEERLELLNHRLESLKHLEQYVRENHDPDAYERYSEHDIAVQQMIQDNPMLITASSLPPDGELKGNAMVKQNTYFSMESGYTSAMINALKFNDEEKIEELLNAGFIYAITEYTPLNVYLPQYSSYDDMYFVEVLDGYLKGVKGFIIPDHILIYG